MWIEAVDPERIAEFFQNYQDALEAFAPKAANVARGRNRQNRRGREKRNPVTILRSQVKLSGVDSAQEPRSVKTSQITY